MRVLIIEDEPKVRNFVSGALSRAGMLVDAVPSLDEADSLLHSTEFDVVVLDRMLGARDSLHAIPQLRKDHAIKGLIVLSAYGEPDDRVQGLDLGADDYLPKPFHVAELIARIRALARRAQTDVSSRHTSVHCLADLRIDLSTQKVTRDGRIIDLSAKEFRMLSVLIQKAGRVFSKYDLLNRVWDTQSDPGSNVVEVTIARLRSKIDEHSPQLPLIHTKRGAGYWIGERE